MVKFDFEIWLRSFSIATAHERIFILCKPYFLSAFQICDDRFNIISNYNIHRFCRYSDFERNNFCELKWQLIQDNNENPKGTNHWPCVREYHRWSVDSFRRGPDSKVHGAHLGPTGPRWALYWSHESCYLGSVVQKMPRSRSHHGSSSDSDRSWSNIISILGIVNRNCTRYAILCSLILGLNDMCTL